MKQSTTIEEQINKFKNRGMIISNEDEAKSYLYDLGYFRLGFYCFPFEKKYPDKKNRDHIYKIGTKFDDVVDLYFFDNDLRYILTRYLSRIEINFRTKLVYIVSNTHKSDPDWYIKDHIIELKHIKTLKKKLKEPVFTNNKIIKAHKQKYIYDDYPPAWKILECMTFGDIIKLYDNLKGNHLKLQIAKEYNISNIRIFTNYMNVLKNTRNNCAHHGTLFDINLDRSIKTGPAGKIGTNNNNISGVLMVVKYLTNEILDFPTVTAEPVRQ